MSRIPGSAVRSRHQATAVVSAVLLTGFAVLTTWNFTRSTALAEASLAYARNDLTRALAKALDHLDRQPWSASAALMAARCLSQMGYARDAEAYFKRAGRLSDADLQIRAAGLARALPQERATPLDPSRYQHYLELCTLAVQQQQSEQALQYLDQARMFAPRQSDVLYVLAASYRELGRPGDAANLQEEAANLNAQPVSASRRAESPWPRYAL
jgi:tetratricopeptide (TPR) repeat protein